MIDTATAALSIALLDGDTVVAEAHELVGRGHAERLIPLIAELPERGRADAILVDCGPGSFTGIRVGLAAARGLGLAWGVPVHGYSAIALIAAAAAAQPDAPERLTVALTGGHGELFVQRFVTAPFRADTGLQSLPPDSAAEAAWSERVIGSGAEALVAAAGRGAAREAWPRAADVVRLSAEARALPPSPIYGRAPDAKVPA